MDTHRAVAPQGTARSPRVAVHLPAEALRGLVTFYYFVTAEDALEDFLYPEWGNVRFALSGDWRLSMQGHPPGPQRNVLCGHTDRCFRVTTAGGRVAGFGLTPLGWLKLIGEDAEGLANRTRPLQAELGCPAEEIRAALTADDTEQARVARFDRLLCDLSAGRAPASPQLLLLDEVLRTRPVDVPAFAAAVGVSSRTLHRLCLRLFGFAPKRLLRRQRFLDTLGQVRSAVGEPLQEALDAAYFDQAHFYRDFRDFMGMSPRAYFTAARTLMARAAAAQVAAGVTLSFRLPPALNPG